jgi:hypothetical protein
MDDSRKDEKPWIVAAKRFLQAGFRPGDFLSDGWLSESFGLPNIDKLTYQEWKDIRSKLRCYRRRFELWLMKHGGFAFDRVPPSLDVSGNIQASGLRLVGRLHPLQHLLRQTLSLRSHLRRADNVHAKRLSYIDRSKLTTFEIAENHEALAKLAALERLHLRLRGLRKRIGRSLRQPRAEWGGAYVASLKELADFLWEMNRTL